VLGKGHREFYGLFLFGERAYGKILSRLCLPIRAAFIRLRAFAPIVRGTEGRKPALISNTKAVAGDILQRLLLYPHGFSDSLAYFVCLGGCFSWEILNQGSRSVSFTNPSSCFLCGFFPFFLSHFSSEEKRDPKRTAGARLVGLPSWFGLLPGTVRHSVLGRESGGRRVSRALGWSPLMVLGGGDGWDFSVRGPSMDVVPILYRLGGLAGLCWWGFCPSILICGGRMVYARC